MSENNKKQITSEKSNSAEKTKLALETVAKFGSAIGTIAGILGSLIKPNKD